MLEGVQSVVVVGMDMAFCVDGQLKFEGLTNLVSGECVSGFFV